MEKGGSVKLGAGRGAVNGPRWRTAGGDGGSACASVETKAVPAHRVACTSSPESHSAEHQRFTPPPPLVQRAPPLPLGTQPQSPTPLPSIGELARVQDSPSKSAGGAEESVAGDLESVAIPSWLSAGPFGVVTGFESGLVCRFDFSSCSWIPSARATKGVESRALTSGARKVHGEHCYAKD